LENGGIASGGVSIKSYLFSLCNGWQQDSAHHRAANLPVFSH
jgi:hypothetical protein